MSVMASYEYMCVLVADFNFLILSSSLEIFYSFYLWYFPWSFLFDLCVSPMGSTKHYNQ